MKELFRERDVTRVGYFQSVLEAESIPTFMRNQDTTMVMTAIPIPEFFPALCVLNDEDYDAAREILRKHVKEDEVLCQQEIACPQCKEPNPANFELCWSCSASLKEAPTSAGDLT